jgi:hypothetical protein
MQDAYQHASARICVGHLIGTVTRWRAGVAKRLHGTALVRLLHCSSMATTITVGKARLATITLISGGVPDTTTALTTSTGNPTTLRCTVNPSNPREVAVVGLAPSAGVNAIVSAPGFGAASLFEVQAAPPPADGLTFGAWGPEIDPPAWA